MHALPTQVWLTHDVAAFHVPVAPHVCCCVRPLHCVWFGAHMPWQAALRIRPPDRYLEDRLIYYGVTRVVDENTRPGSTIFTFTPIPEAYTSRKIVVSFQAAANKVMEGILYTAVVPEFVARVEDAMQTDCPSAEVPTDITDLDQIYTDAWRDGFGPETLDDWAPWGPTSRCVPARVKRRIPEPFQGPHSDPSEIAVPPDQPKESSFKSFG